MKDKWISTHPWQALGRAVWLLFNLTFWGASGAFLAWGPLNGDMPLMVIVGVASALLHTGLWTRQQLAAVRGRGETARRWRRGLLGGQAAIVGGIGLLVVIQLYQIGTLPPLSQDRGANFDRLWDAMDAHYPYFERKDVDWEEMYARYRPQIEQATSDREYYVLIGRMLAELNDAHTSVVPSLAYEAGCSFASTREMAGQAVVTVVRSSGGQVGLEVGAVVLTVDGQPIEQALNAVDPRLRAGSTPWQRHNRAFQHLLRTPFGGRREITFETADGMERTATLACTEQVAAAESQGGDAWDLLLPAYRRELVSRRLPSGLGYIRVPTLGVDLVDEFDAALDEMMDAPGLILDLRGNGGGNSAFGDRIAGRLLDQPFVYGRDYYGGRLPTRGWRKWMPFEVTPREPVYAGPVVVIIETTNMSSAEQFLVSLVDSGRVETVGRRTGGASANPVRFRLPGAHNARFSTADFRRNDGTSIEGVGITPDVQVTWTVEDMRQGRDPDLEAAQQLLLNELAQGW